MAEEILSLEEARALALRCLVANGCDDQNAAPVAESMVAAERDHCHSHGLFRLPGYVKGLRVGTINGRARPQVFCESPGVLRVAGDHAMAPVAHESCLGVLAREAKQRGMAFAGLQRAHHFSALWVEIEALAEEGLCALACVSYLPVMTPAGGSKRTFGTNPISFGWPRPGGLPLVFDMATSAMARGEIMIAEREGRTLPPGAGVGPDGAPSTDPATVLAGSQLPFGGYKGSALALMVELLAGPMIGETFSLETADSFPGGEWPPPGGEFILAMDPAALGGNDWDERAQRLFGVISGMEGARLPGDRRHAARARSPGEGAAFPRTLLETIRQLADL